MDRETSTYVSHVVAREFEHLAVPIYFFTGTPETLRCMSAWKAGEGKIVCQLMNIRRIVNQNDLSWRRSAA